MPYVKCVSGFVIMFLTLWCICNWSQNTQQAEVL